MYTLDFTVTLHQLRHTYITNLIYSGIDPKTVQYLAGHAHIWYNSSRFYIIKTVCYNCSTIRKETLSHV